MKLTKSQLKQIIKEEIETLINEGFGPGPSNVDTRKRLADLEAKKSDIIKKRSESDSNELEAQHRSLETEIANLKKAIKEDYRDAADKSMADTVPHS